MASVTVKDVSKAYGSVKVMDGLDLAIADGEFVVLVGPSGCGKSTLLRMIAGLETGNLWRGRDRRRVVNRLHPKDRNIAMVFQNYALYAHMTVLDNMAFSLQLKNRPKAEIARRSAGQRRSSISSPICSAIRANCRAANGSASPWAGQSCAIPTSSCSTSRFSNLDAKLRVQMRTEIKELHQRLKTTTVYVTHDQIEAMTMADRIVIMRDGTIEQIGKPLDRL